jgi:hypothetical protein
MKKIFFLFAVVALFASCSGGGTGEGDGNDSTATEQTMVDKLTPSKVDVNKPVSVAELSEAYYAWKDKEVTITGFCNFFFDEGAIDTVASLTAVAGDGTVVIECSMKQAYPETFAKTSPVTIKAKIKEGWFGKILLEKGELVSKGTDVASVGYIDPFNYKGENMSVKDFYASFYGWKDKEITVTGYYYSTTTSTTSYGVTVRVDLADPTDNNIIVGCEMEGEVPEDIVNNRDGVKIRGFIGEEAFGKVQLVKCKIVK